MSYSYKFAQERVNGILKNLPADDREVLEAYVADVRDDARTMRPAHNFATTLGVLLPLVVGIIGLLYFVVPRFPVSPCETCAVCPAPPEPLEWLGYGNPVKVRRAETDKMSCLWPADSWTYLCTIKTPKPDDTMPIIPPNVEAPQ